MTRLVAEVRGTVSLGRYGSLDPGCVDRVKVSIQSSQHNSERALKVCPLGWR